MNLAEKEAYNRHVQGLSEQAILDKRTSIEEWRKNQEYDNFQQLNKAFEVQKNKQLWEDLRSQQM